MDRYTDRTNSNRPGGQEMLLIRHGQSTATASGVWQGQLDFPLSEEGRRQAASVGRALKSARISGVYASPLSRAFETAEIVAREAGFSGEIIPMSGIAERHGGILEGHTWAEQEARNPAFAETFLALSEEERWAFADAETDEEILERFKAALSKIRSRQSVRDGAIVVVTHGGVMRAFLRDLFGPSVLPGHERAPNASITRLLYDPADTNAAPRLLKLASTSHLSWEEERHGQTRIE
jgi:broad specificity phosphatase PhoE